MNYNFWKEENDEVMERYALSMGRIEEIINEETVKEEYRDFFVKTAKFILLIKEVADLTCKDSLKDKSLEELQELNHKLYEDILPENYKESYGNPTYAVSKLGKRYGKQLGFLYTEIRGMIDHAFKCKMHFITIYAELFIEIYNYFEGEDAYTYKDIKRAIYDFKSDYAYELDEYITREFLDPALSMGADIINGWDLTDLRYLYQFGKYVGKNEVEVAKFLNQLSEEEVKAMAFTFTDGYRRGFVNAGIDLSKKSMVAIRYNLGFERMVYYAMKNFNEMGLMHTKIQYASLGANRQCVYDHRFDAGMFLNKAYCERRLEAIKKSYENCKELAAGYAGPAVIQVFGEENFEPENKSAAIKLDKRQEKLFVDFNRQAGLITNQYVRGPEVSFTIIAYPIPEIGDNFKEIFAETVKVNTLDNDVYKEIQQHIIDALDQGEYVRILGCNDNKTDLKVMLCELNNPEKETIFENCTADVNIPVGEVFTSPKLTGTEGILHVSHVYLRELEYKELSLTFTDGKITDYDCKNFKNEEDNKKFIKENLLHSQETLPLGEFAIGTNTTAYAMAKKYDIAKKLPILIAEKTGPHFAVGDTCFKMSEDRKVYNPDGKEIIARDNEISILRKTDITKAYFNCHTDITIPYDELGEITVYKKDGQGITIIKGGKFILPGTEKLNDAL